MPFTAQSIRCDEIYAEVLRSEEDHPEDDIIFMAGGVASAFRNVCIHSKSVHLVACVAKEESALIIELCAAFERTGSPGYYEIFGGAFMFVHSRSTNKSSPRGFFSNCWVDDHVNVAHFPTTDLGCWARSLRFAMVSMLGPAAISEVKFTGWHKELKVRGLLFDTTSCTVARPQSKIDMARLLVTSAYHVDRLRRKQYRSLLGSLRHVITCIRATRPFLQRLRAQECGSSHRFGDVSITPHMNNDLLWWWQVLQSRDHNGVPTSYFQTLPAPDVVVEMDTSNYGLCAFDVTNQRFYTYGFSPEKPSLIAKFKNGEKNEFDINFREPLTAAFAVISGVTAGRQRRCPCRYTFTSASTTLPPSLGKLRWVLGTRARRFS